MELCVNVKSGISAHMSFRKVAAQLPFNHPKCSHVTPLAINVSKRNVICCGEAKALVEVFVLNSVFFFILDFFFF